MQEVKEETKESFPVSIDRPEEMEAYLMLNENFSKNFYLEKGDEDELVEKLDENPNNLIYRGMSPDMIFELMTGNKVNVKPYRYEEASSVLPEEDLQNATYLYSNAIPHGYDRELKYSFLTAVGFSPEGLDGLIIKGTGQEMARRLVAAKDVSSIPQNREKDITIEGEINPESVMVYCFRFRVGDKMQTLVYRRRKQKIKPK